MNNIGLVLYSIELDGCLNGVYTNEAVDGQIFNEIAIKIDPPNLPSTICGDYSCTFFEGALKRYNVTLIIVLKPGLSDTYDFRWVESGKPIFEGVGYKMNERQVAVWYKGI